MNEQSMFSHPEFISGSYEQSKHEKQILKQVQDDFMSKTTLLTYQH